MNSQDNNSDPWQTKKRSSKLIIEKSEKVVDIWNDYSQVLNQEKLKEKQKKSRPSLLDCININYYLDITTTTCYFKKWSETFLKHNFFDEVHITDVFRPHLTRQQFIWLSSKIKEDPKV